MDDIRDEGVAVADLVAQVSVLERLDERRDRLIGQLRRTASAGQRPARTSPPVREILLETLAYFRWPQNAGSSRSIYCQAPAATRQPRVRTPAPRRAERLGPRTRRPRGVHRPCPETGRFRDPRWLTRSDWDLERRVVATTRTERLFDLYKIYVLAGRPGSAEASYLGPRTPVDALLRSTRRTFSTPNHYRQAHPTASSGRGAPTCASAPAPSSGKPREDEPDRKQIARQLASLTDASESGGGPQARVPKAAKTSAQPYRPPTAGKPHTGTQLTRGYPRSRTTQPALGRSRSRHLPPRCWDGRATSVRAFTGLPNQNKTGRACHRADVRTSA